MKKIKSLLCVIVAIFTFFSAQAQKKKHTFEVKNGNFVYDGKTIQIHSGEMHYARIPEAYWRQRLKMARAMGLNTVATYVFWNFHEVSPNVWDWKSEGHNLAKFIKTAQEEGLMVILRPGPYVCAEWEYGGYPWFLQNVPGMEVRTNTESFLKANKTYIQQLYNQVKDLQITNGGPIIMVQAENEFGSFVAQRKDINLASHKTYASKVLNDLKSVGFNVPFFTSDGSWLFEGGAIAGTLPTANGEDNVDDLKKVVNQYHDNKGPYMVAEFYPGWLDHWAEPFPKVGAAQIVKQTEKYIDNGVSFNYYMVHGGTNFGFNSGANYDNKHGIQPDLTSYDYDAPISEAGWATPKYEALRTLLMKTDSQTPAVPAPNPVIEIPSINLDLTADILDLKDYITPVEADTPQTFESLKQGHGYVIYSRQFNQPISGKMSIPGLRDYATVYVNGEKVGELNRYYNKFDLNIDIPFNATLDIMVENLGRINYGSKINENNKGIIGSVSIESKAISGGWKMYKMPMDEQPDFKKITHSQNKVDRPTLYHGTFTLDAVGDTFLNTENWGKGIVFVNGHHIGRFWSVGPQQTLYLPGAWLKKGANEIVIMDQRNHILQTAINAVKIPVLEKLNPEKEKDFYQ